MCELMWYTSRYRWFAFHWRSLEWWGGMCYTIGVVGYNIAAISAVIYDCKMDQISLNTYVRGITLHHARDMLAAGCHLWPCLPADAQTLRRLS